jgi:hypothetical protein
VDPSAAEEPVVRSRRVTTLGALCLAMGAWGIFFSYHVHLAFVQVAQSFGWGRYTVHLGKGGRPDNERWIVGYCIVAAFLMAAGGAGLLRRKAWGPRTVAIAGIAWILSALASISYHVNVAWTLRPSMQPHAGGLRWMLSSYAVASVVAFAFGIVCAACPFRPRLRAECGDTGALPGSLATLAIGAWGSFCAWATTSGCLHFWYSVLD